MVAFATERSTSARLDPLARRLAVPLLIVALLVLLPEIV